MQIKTQSNIKEHTVDKLHLVCETKKGKNYTSMFRQQN